MKPYYEHAGITIYHGQCWEVASLCEFMVTDPPYPNNAGHFENSIDDAREFLHNWRGTEGLIFWSELEHPPIELPLVAVHIWRRTTSWNKLYEPIYHYAVGGERRRSDVKEAGVVYDGVFAACHQYVGHPTQKNEFVMKWLIRKLPDSVLIADPFMGSGTTLFAAKALGHPAVGIEIEEKYCEIAAKRLSQEVFAFGETSQEQPDGGPSPVQDLLR